MYKRTIIRTIINTSNMESKNFNPIDLLKRYMTRKSYSYNTIDAYIKSIDKVRKHAKKDIYNLNQYDFNSYIDKVVIVKNQSHSTINTVISAGVLYLKYGLNKKQYSIRQLERPRKEKKLPVILSPEEVNIMIKAANNIKHKAIILTLYDLLLRRQELIDLKWSDIDRGRMIVHIKQSKGAKDRTVPLTDRLVQCLEIYCRKYKPKEYVFNGQFDLKYSATSISKVLKKCSESINKKVYPHLIRHSAASHLLDEGIDLNTLQRMLGHYKLSTTQTYLHTTTRTFRNIKRAILDSIYEK